MKTFRHLLAAIAILASGAATQSIAASSVYAGATVDIDQPVGTDVVGAGARVTVSAPIEGKARLTGGHVEIAPGGSVSRDARLAGGNVVMKGAVGGDLRAGGGHVTIDGAVGGDVSVTAGTLELGPNARIAGKLSYRADTFERDSGAQVAGPVERSARRGRSWSGESSGHWVGRALWTLGLMLLAAVIAGALPGPARRLQEELRTRPWLASLLGLTALICIPIAAVLVMITLIGIPIGLIALMGYAALLIVGYVMTSVLVGGLLLDRFKADRAARVAWRVGAAVLVMLVIATLGRVPYVGGFVALVTLVVGVGAIVAVALHRTREAPAAA